LCNGCLLSIALGLKRADSEEEKEAVKRFVTATEKDDPRKMRVKDYFISDFGRKFLLNHSFHPNVVGHLVVQPIEHITQLHEPFARSPDKTNISESDALELISVIRKVSTLLEECLTLQDYPTEKIYVCTFNESPDWHLHFHIVPRAKQEVIIGPSLMTYGGREITRKEVENVVKHFKTLL
jgi:diadenosine tetraphosphate (Ap4A) HIT family hydrolase